MSITRSRPTTAARACRCSRDQGAGADVVSGGELRRRACAGIPAARIVYSGVGKSAQRTAAGAVARTLARSTSKAPRNWRCFPPSPTPPAATARVALRVNPDVDAGTNDKITHRPGDRQVRHRVRRRARAVRARRRPAGYRAGRAGGRISAAKSSSRALSRRVRPHRRTSSTPSASRGCASRRLIAAAASASPIETNPRRPPPAWPRR